MIEIRTNLDYLYVPECLKECNRHYVPKNDRYITCKEFGQIDGMDGACWWCREMTPYQWVMCWDESWLRSLTNPSSKYHFDTKEKAIEFIEKNKQKNPTSIKKEQTIQQKINEIKNSYEDIIRWIKEDRNKYKDRYEELKDMIYRGHFGDLEYILEELDEEDKKDEVWDL